MLIQLLVSPCASTTKTIVAHSIINLYKEAQIICMIFHSSSFSWSLLETVLSSCDLIFSLIKAANSFKPDFLETLTCKVEGHQKNWN